jgi:hypothetical protein
MFNQQRLHTSESSDSIELFQLFICLIFVLAEAAHLFVLAEQVFRVKNVSVAWNTWCVCVVDWFGGMLSPDTFVATLSALSGFL